MPEAQETPKPYKTDEEAKKIALREIANKISICLGFEQSEDQRLYTKEITPGNYEIRFEERKEDVDTYGNPTGNKSRYTSLVFNSSNFILSISILSILNSAFFNIDFVLT